MTLGQSLRSRSLWIVALGLTVGGASGGITPWIVGQLIATAHYSGEQAALAVTVEQVAQGLVMLSLSPFLGMLPRRRLVSLGLLLLLVAQLASMAAPGPVPMLAARLLSGFGFGIVYCVSAALGAATTSPERSFAFAQTVTFVTALAYNPMLGLAADQWGIVGVFAVILIYCAVLALPLAVLLFRGINPLLTARRRSDRPVASINGRSAAAALAAMTFYSLATGGIWAFMERIATTAGISGPALGAGLTVVSFLGLAGSISAVRLGNRFGRALPIGISLPLLGLASVAFAISASPPAFWITISLWVIVYSFSLPYVFGLAAATDSGGRVAALSASAFTLLSALGVSLGARIVTAVQLVGLGATAGALCVLSAVIGVLLALRLAPSVVVEDASPAIHRNDRGIDEGRLVGGEE